MESHLDPGAGIDGAKLLGLQAREAVVEVRGAEEPQAAQVGAL